MKVRNNIMILDTETIGNFGKPLVHDVGFVIVDKNFTILYKDRILVEELHKKALWLLNSNSFYSERKKDYEMARKTEKIMPWAKISKHMADMIRHYHVGTVSAYNLQFDYRALKYTDDFFSDNHISKILDEKSKYKLCIYNLACETILNTENYHNFAKAHNLISEKGNYKTNAESAYQYITGNTEYIEKHTSLSDSLDEMEILKYIVRNVKKCDKKYGLYYNCWMKAQ